MAFLFFGYARQRTEPGLFFSVKYANEQNVLRHRGIVVIKTLGAKTPVPCAGIRGRNESAAYRYPSGSYDSGETHEQIRKRFQTTDVVHGIDAGRSCGRMRRRC
jgi:hypothetical protein